MRGIRGRTIQNPFDKRLYTSVLEDSRAIFVKREPASNLLFLRRKKTVSESVSIKSELGWIKKMWREKCKPHKKPRRKSKQKHTHCTLTKNCQRKTFVSIDVESRKINRVRFFRAIHAFGCGRNAVTLVHAMRLSVVHIKNTKHRNTDNAENYDSCSDGSFHRHSKISVG